MNDDLGIGKALSMFMVISTAFFIILPLAIWKMIDIVIWLYKHIKIG